MIRENSTYDVYFFMGGLPFYGGITGIVRCSFDLKRILDKEYIFKQIRQLERQKEGIKNSFLSPIIRALNDIWPSISE